MHTHPEKVFCFNTPHDGLDRYIHRDDASHPVAGHMHLWIDTAYYVLDTPRYDCRADGIEIMQRHVVDPASNDVVTLDKVYKFDRQNPWRTQCAQLTTLTDLQSSMMYDGARYDNIALHYITPMTVTRYDMVYKDTLVQATQWHVPSLPHDIALLTLNPVVTVAANAMKNTPAAVADARSRRLDCLYELIDDMLGHDLLEPMADMPMQQVAKGMCVFKMP